MKGIGFKLISVTFFMAMSALIKATADEVPPGEAVFFRSLFAIPVILVWLYATHAFGEGLRTANPVGHLWRGLLGTTAMGCGFAGLGFLPLPEVTAIGYAAPLLTVIFAAMFLGEEVRVFRITTVGLGMVGVLIILSPRLSALQSGAVGTVETLGAIIVLVGAVFSALAQVFVRKLVLAERTTAMGCSFAGLGFLPLPEVTAIGYAAPLLTVIFAAMFLGEEVRAFRITTVGLGMVGVLIILSPRLSALQSGAVGTVETLGAIIVLVGAVFSALAQVFVRKLVLAERTTAIVFYFSLTSTCASLVTLPFGWVWPAPATAAMLISAGLLGGVGQVLLTSSYRFADASVVAPFEYASMILALLVGYFVFAEVPTGVVLQGAALVMAAGIAIIWRERQLGLKRDRQRKSMTPQG